MKLTRRERATRLEAARDFVKKERKAGRISRGQAIRIRGFLRFRSDEVVDGAFDDLVALQEEEEGYALPRLGDGTADWPAFFGGLAGLLDKLLPLLLGMCG